jgi:hypothetical protein
LMTNAMRKETTIGRTRMASVLARDATCQSSHYLFNAQKHKHFGKGGSLGNVS